MNTRIRRAFLIGLSALWVAACGTSGSNDSNQSTTQPGSSAGNVGTSGCTDRSSAVGIEGGGLVRRLAGTITNIGSDGTLVIGCTRVSTADAVVLIDGKPGTLNDLQIGEIVEVVGNIDPESGTMRAQSISPKGISEPTSHGRYVGTVTVGGQQLFGDALITVDGAVRLYVGGPYDNGGELQLTRPAAGSAQFVGHLETATNASGSATGLVIGQGCTDPQVVRFCSEAANGEMTFTVSPVSGAAIDAKLSGVLHVATSGGEETWLLDLGNWANWYLLSASGDNPGQFLYREELAEFAADDDTVITFSGSQLQFQSAHSGCTGNGSIMTHGDGAFFVFDVVLDIGNCNATYARFNGRFEGLASSTASSVWDYDDQFRMWLSKPNGTEPPVALTMLSTPIY
jgi:hypothetical protein